MNRLWRSEAAASIAGVGCRGRAAYAILVHDTTFATRRTLAATGRFAARLFCSADQRVESLLGVAVLVFVGSRLVEAAGGREKGVHDGKAENSNRSTASLWRNIFQYTMCRNDCLEDVNSE